MTTKRNKTNLSMLAAAMCFLLLVAPLSAQPTSASNREARIAELVGMEMAGAVHANDDILHDTDEGGRCVSLPDLSIMFDTDATLDGMIDTLNNIPDDSLFGAYLPQGSRWTTTATDGAVSQGQRITLTYSFVPDGTPITIAGATGTEQSTLFANFDATFPGGRAAWKAKFAQAFNQWGELLNITYVEVSDDGAAFPTSTGQLGSRGDIRIAMRSLGEPLAVNFFPQFGGDMVLDSLNMAEFSNSNGDFIRLRNVLGHEHGHGLGLNHTVPQSGTKLMEPALNTNFDGPQEDDIRGAQFIYGDWAEPNTGIGDEEFLGGPLRDVASGGTQVFEFENLSLERSGESDWYGFTAFAMAPIAIRVDPIGTTYDFAPQNNPASETTVNAKSIRNLGLRLWRRVSAQTNQIQMVAQIDFNAVGEAEYHPPVPYSIAGYMLAEIYSNDNVNDSQRYKLTLSNSAIAAPVEPASMTVFNVAAGQQVFDGTSVQFGQVNIGSSNNNTLSIANAGPGTLQIGQITLAGPGAADYGFTLLQSTIAPGSTGNLAVSFSPSASGVRQAVMTIPNNDPDQANFSFILSGSGVQPAAPVMEVRVNNVVVNHNNTVDLGDVEIGDSATASLIVKNVGNATLNVSNINFGGAAAGEYSATVSSANLSPGAQVTASVTVAPLAAGNRDAELRLFNNSSQSLFVVRFTTNGVQPQQPITDCNSNGIDDAQDLADGTSEDCNTNGVPDECEVDSDNDGVIDDCDVCAGEDDNLDTDGDGTPNCLDQDPVDPDVGGNPLPPPPEDNNNRNGLCGVGSAMPMMAAVLGLCGAGLGRRRRK